MEEKNINMINNEDAAMVTGGRIVLSKEEKLNGLVWSITTMKKDGSSREEVIDYWNKLSDDGFVQSLDFDRAQFLAYLGETYDRV